MLLKRKIVCLFTTLVLFTSTFSQHPDLKAIDSLQRHMSVTHGISRINCITALGEEYWWPPRVNADSIFLLASLAMKESVNIHYNLGIANSTMLLGVAYVYRKNLVSGEEYLRQALSLFQQLNNDDGFGWSYIWLAQSLYSQNRFNESLYYYNKAIPYLNKTNNWEGKGKAWAWLAFVYATLGEYDSSFYYCSNSLLLRQRMSDHVCVAASITNMGQLFKVAGAYEDALDYYRQGYQYAKANGIDEFTINWNYLEPVGLLYRLMNAPDSSYYFLYKAMKIDSTNEITKISFAESLLMKKQTDSALSIFMKPVDRFRKGNDQWDLMRILMDIAKCYEQKKDYTTALHYAVESSSIAEKAKAKQYILDGYRILSKLYKNNGSDDSAYRYQTLYLDMKDSVVNKQFLWKLSNYKKQTDFKIQLDQLAVLGKENKQKEEELKEKKVLQWVLISVLAGATLTCLMLYKNFTLKRKNEKLKNEREKAVLKQNASEIEMQALRAQMNPHFIFNCLSSINSFILKNETDAASGYLTKFSRLIRMVLINSKKQFISLEDELETLCLYLDMEKLRFMNSFDYKITFANSVDAGAVFLPPLLLQPFAENAIWHGLMHKEGQGHLDIEISIDGKILCCAITDNGIGRLKAEELKTKSAQKQKSMGLQITTERLALLNGTDDRKTYFNIADLYDNKSKVAGTRVVLNIHYKDSSEITS
ncbi:MAG: tetratricopeptide repeat protein [Chitinophagaceae bacterium]